MTAAPVASAAQPRGVAVRALAPPSPLPGVVAAVLGAIGLVIALAAPLVMSNRSLAMAITAGLFALMAYGVSITYGLIGSLSVGVAVAWGGSSFAAAMLSSDAGWPFWAVLVASVAIAVAISFVVALPCARTHGHYFVILTFAVAEVMYLLAEQSSTLSNSGAGISTFEVISIFGYEFESRRSLYHLTVALVVIAGLAFVALRRSRVGRRMMAVREHEDLALSMGIRVLTWKMVAFALSGIPIGIAGCVYAYYLHNVTVETFNILKAITIVLIAVLGGARSALGPPLGAATVVFLPELIGLSPNVQQLVYGVALCVVILLLPRGIVPSLQDLPDAVRSRRRRRPTSAIATKTPALPQKETQHADR